MTRRAIRVGTAGWSIPRAVADSLPGDGSHLQRYAAVFHCAEINTSFYRPHRSEVYARWASATPPAFRFAVKIPQSITHDARLRAARRPLAQFLSEASGLGARLGVLLLQLPPSLSFESRAVRRFFHVLRDLFDGPVVCEPRHASWLSAAAERSLVDARVGRVAADPAKWPEAAVPGGWLGADGDGAGAVVYYRWHGAPRMYWSSYDSDWLRARKVEVRKWPDAASTWCIFDNTASGAAIENALRFQQAGGRATRR